MHVQNVHTMDELKMTGNCLKGSRGVVCFDAGFEETEWGRLIKEMFTQVSGNGRRVFYSDELPDIRGTRDGEENQAVRRSYSDILHPRLENLVSQFPGLYSTLTPIPRSCFTRSLKKTQHNHPDRRKRHSSRSVPGSCSRPYGYSKGRSAVRRCFPTMVSAQQRPSPCAYSAAEFVSPAAVRSALKQTKGEKYRHRKDAEEESSRRREGRRREEDELAVSRVFG
jgi:hypothetical protein